MTVAALGFSDEIPVPFQCKKLGGIRPYVNALSSFLGDNYTNRKITELFYGETLLGIMLPTTDVANENFSFLSPAIRSDRGQISEFARLTRSRGLELASLKNASEIHINKPNVNYYCYGLFVPASRIPELEERGIYSKPEAVKPDLSFENVEKVLSRVSAEGEQSFLQHQGWELFPFVEGMDVPKAHIAAELLLRRPDALIYVEGSDVVVRGEGNKPIGMLSRIEVAPAPYVPLALAFHEGSSFGTKPYVAPPVVAAPVAKPLPPPVKEVAEGYFQRIETVLSTPEPDEDETPLAIYGWSVAPVLADTELPEEVVNADLLLKNPFALQYLEDDRVLIRDAERRPVGILSRVTTQPGLTLEKDTGLQPVAHDNIIPERDAPMNPQAETDFSTEVAPEALTGRSYTSWLESLSVEQMQDPQGDLQDAFEVYEREYAIPVFKGAARFGVLIVLPHNADAEQDYHQALAGATAFNPQVTKFGTMERFSNLLARGAERLSQLEQPLIVTRAPGEGLPVAGLFIPERLTEGFDASGLLPKGLAKLPAGWTLAFAMFMKREELRRERLKGMEKRLGTDLGIDAGGLEDVTVTEEVVETIETEELEVELEEIGEETTCEGAADLDETIPDIDGADPADVIEADAPEQSVEEVPVIESAPDEIEVEQTTEPESGAENERSATALAFAGAVTGEAAIDAAPKVAPLQVMCAGECYLSHFNNEGKRAQKVLPTLSAGQALDVYCFNADIGVVVSQETFDKIVDAAQPSGALQGIMQEDGSVASQDVVATRFAKMEDQLKATAQDADAPVIHIHYDAKVDPIVFIPQVHVDALVKAGLMKTPGQEPEPAAVLAAE